MARIGIVIPVALVALAGCTTSASSGDRHAAASGTPVETATSGAPSAPVAGAVDPRHAPQLGDAQQTFIRAGGEVGSRSFPGIPRIQRGTLEVAVICSGSGTIDVSVGSLVSFGVVCAKGDPGQYDEVGLSRSHKDVTVSVTSRTSGSWGLSVGWTRTVSPRG